MAERTRAHEIEDEQERVFTELLAPRFVFRRDIPDYGIDGDVEEFDERRTTGLRFYAQLKATDEEDPGKALAVSLQQARARQYRSLALPLLMVRYHAPTKRIFTRWFHQYDASYEGGGEKYLTFRWEEGDAWNDDRPDELVADVHAFLAMRSASLRLPLPVYVETLGAFGLSTTETVFALRRAGSLRPDVFEVRSGVAPPGRPAIEISDWMIVANLAKATTVNLALGETYDPGPLGDVLAHDAFVVAALAFDRIGQADVASRLAATYLPASSMSGTPQVAWALSSAMARARRVRESLELADQLDQSTDETVRTASAMFVLPADFHAQSLNETEVEAHRAVLQARTERREAEGDNAQAAEAHFELGDFFRSRSGHPQAADSYERAVQLDPELAGRPEYWAHLGGALWGLRRFEEAADAYGRALALGGEPITRALQADCLMFAGKYRDARDLFATFNREERQAGEYPLKERVLTAVTEELSIESQDRDTEASLAAISPTADPTPEELAKSSLAQLEKDALWGSAWFNLGWARLSQGRRHDALTSYIAAAVYNPSGMPHDLEAWKNAITLAMDLEEFDLLCHILMTARRLVANPLMKYLVEFKRKQGGAFPDQILDLVEYVWSQLPEGGLPDERAAEGSDDAGEDDETASSEASEEND